MAEQVQWTRQQQANTLTAIGIVTELLAGGEVHGPIDATLEVVQHVRTPDDLADIVSGLLNLSAMVVEHFSAATGVDQYEILRNAANLVQNVEIID
jgi:hypothetical protein